MTSENLTAAERMARAAELVVKWGREPPPHFKLAGAIMFLEMALAEYRAELTGPSDRIGEWRDDGQGFRTGSGQGGDRG